MMPSDELRAQLDLPALPYHGTYHTVAGLMLALLRRVPREGDRIVWAGWRFEIVDMDGRRVDKVLAIREEVAGANASARADGYFAAWERAIGAMNCASVSQGNRIQVSWLTSVMKVSTSGRPFGLA